MNRRFLLKLAGLAAAAKLTAQTPAQTQPFCSLNQLGYRPRDPKTATLRGLSSQDTTFTIRSLDSNELLFTGALPPPTLDNASGDQVRLATFSSLAKPGTYRLEAPGLFSDTFHISNDVYADALRLTMRSYYGQRCGCAVDLGQGYSHPPCHLAGAYGIGSNQHGAVPNHGGWHDAGDYGRYIVNSGITTGTLLWAWELYPQSLRNLHLDLPESHHPLPDYLAEIRWNLNWMLSLQDTDGGVFHKQTSAAFSPFVMPQDDLLLSQIIGTGSAPYKSTCATADLAAVMAIAARVYRPLDPAFAQTCLAAAKSAWSWASAHPDVTFKNPPGVTTGEYGDPHCADELLWASAELWRTTSEPQYEAAFLHGLPSTPDQLTIGTPSWNNLASMACWTYALASPSGPDSGPWKDRIVEATRHAALDLVARQKSSGYGNTLALSDYIWGSNSVAANQSLLLLLSHHLHPDPETANAALSNLHYLLGRNCHGVSWVTQLGHRPFLHPHHRPSAADGIPAPWPGLLSGGPNAHPADPTARTLPQAPPMRMWLDDQRAYSMNEVAINWNAPLVFLLAFANQNTPA